jgi:hypothetical protein
MAQDDSSYSKPELREQIKDRIMAGDRGAAKKVNGVLAKSTSLLKSMKKRAVDTKEARGEAQKDLSKWTKEKWGTKDEYEKRAKAKAAAKKYKESK